MDGHWQAMGAGAGNWGPGDVTGTFRSMIGGTGNVRTIGGNTGVDEYPTICDEETF